MHPATLPELMNIKDDDLLQGLLQNCFMTLLGATALLLQTRTEVAVYVSALQRQMRSARAVGLRRLNRIIRWAQRNPRGLTYNQLPEPRVLLAIGDSAFQAPSEEDMASGKEPLVMRGYILAWAHRIDGNHLPRRPAAGEEPMAPRLLRKPHHYQTKSSKWRDDWL